MKGPPSIEGVLTAVACTCGARMYDSIIRQCRPHTFMAAVAGEIRCDQAYQRCTSGCATTSGRRYTQSEFTLNAFRRAIGEVPTCAYTCHGAGGKYASPYSRSVVAATPVGESVGRAGA